MGYFLSESLFDPSYFENQLELLHQKYQIGGLEYHILQNEVSLAEMAQDSSNFCRALVKTLKQGKYEFTPASLRTIVVGGKERVLYRFVLTDLLIHGVVAKVLMDHCAPQFSPHLYSYLKGKNWWDGVRDFSAFSRQYFHQEKDIKKRGLFVLRRDIAKYTDSIPVGETTPMWPLLKEVLHYPERPSKQDSIALSIVKSVIRTEAYTLEEKAHFTTWVGVPTGSPISTTLFNIYMIKLDQALDQMKPDFYARYGDDLIFADRDPAKAGLAAEVMKRVLKAYWLKSNESKSQTFYFNRAGRGFDQAPFEKGSQTTDFLGCLIAADGTVSLNRKKTKKLLSDLNARVGRVIKTLKTENDENRVGTLVCRVINEALNPENALAHKSAGLLRYAITDREYLRDLDLQICKLVMQWCTGSASVKGFRKISPARMRTDWKLQSILHARNMHGK